MSLTPIVYVARYMDGAIISINRDVIKVTISV